MSAKVFRRKDLKHDEFITVAGRVSQWLMQRRRRIGWALLVVALVFSVFVSVRFYQDRQEQRAAALLAAAMEVFRAPVVPPVAAIPTTSVAPSTDPVTVPAPEATSDGSTQNPDTDPTVEAAEPPADAADAAPVAMTDEGASPPSAASPPAPVTPTGLQFASETEKYTAARERFMPIVERYGNRPSGRVAAFYLGICEAELGDTAAAIAALSRTAEASEPLIAAMALFRLGQLELDLGDAEAATGHFDRLLERRIAVFPREEALMAKGRAQRAGGDLRGAMATYQRVVDDFAGSFPAVDARTQVEELAAELGLDPDVEGG